MARGEFLVGLDLGGSKMLAVAFSRRFEPLGRCKLRTQVDRGGDGLVQDLAAAVRGALEEAGGSIEGLVAAGVGAPGAVDAAAGVVHVAPNLGLADFPLGAKLAERLGRPVTVENDVNAGTLAEVRLGAASGRANVLGVFPGTGIGGGLVLEGRLYRGTSGAAGEIGHTLVSLDGPLCGCGRHGCLEALAARPAVAAQAAVLAMRGAAPWLAANVGTDPREIRSSALARSIKAGDAAVEDLVRRAARTLGRGLSGVLNALCPDTVVLGGGMVEAMPKLFREEVGAGIAEGVLEFIARRIEVRVAKLGDDAVALGAASLAEEALG